MEDENSFLGPTSITGKHIEQAFREYIKDESLKLIKVETEIIATGHGFTSFIIRLTLTWNDADKIKHKNLPKTAILKALSKDSIEKLFDKFSLGENEGRHEFSQMVIMGHKYECIVYEMFANCESPVPIACAYATWIGDSDRPPLILLEDLGERARVLGDGTASLTYKQMLSVAEAQASLHAWCMTTDQKWREKFEKFDDRIKAFAAFMPMMQQGLIKAKEAFPSAFGKLDEAKIGKLFEMDHVLQLNNEYKPWFPDVLNHGDFWANNIMFNKLPDGSMGDDIVAVIDWQLPLVGNPMTDLGRMLSMSFDGKLRETHFDDIIKHYYSALKTKMGDRMPEDITFDRVVNLIRTQTALSCLMMFTMQEAMQALFVSGNSPEDEAKRQRIIKSAEESLDYAAKILDISVDQ